jgi:hypothetical protein
MVNSMDGQPSSTHDLSPDGQVAQQIVAQFAERGLIGGAQAAALAHSLADGTLKAADWRLIAENALEMEARRGAAR